MITEYDSNTKFPEFRPAKIREQIKQKPPRVALNFLLKLI